MSIVVDVNQLERDGKEYLEIVVPPYPVAINCKGVYYYRSGSTMQTLLAQNWRASFYANVVLRGIICPCRDLRWMILMMSWSRDSRPLPPRRAGSTKAFRRGQSGFNGKLRLTNAGYYTNAAMLLFCKDPDRWQLGAYTKSAFRE